MSVPLDAAPTVVDTAVRMAANLGLDEQINARLAKGEPILHLGFGESRLPLYPGLTERLTIKIDQHEIGVTGLSTGVPVGPVSLVGADERSAPP